MKQAIFDAMMETKAYTPERAHRIENIVDGELHGLEKLENYSFNLTVAMDHAKAHTPGTYDKTAYVVQDLHESIIQEYDAHQ